MPRTTSTRPDPVSTGSFPLLTSWEDWPAWEAAVKRLADRLGHWDHVKTEGQTPLPPKPDEFDDASVDLTTDEGRSRFNVELKLHELRAQRYRAKMNAEADIIQLMEETTSAKLKHHFQQATTAHDMLLALASQLKPSVDKLHEMVDDKFTTLYSSPQRTSLAAWCQAWKVALVEAKRYELDDLVRSASRRFLRALQPIDPAYVDPHRAKRGSSTKYPDIDVLIKEVSEMTAGRTAPAPSISFAANPKPTERSCICGDKHRYRNCPYLVESVRTANWSPNPDIAKRIEDAMKGSAKLCSNIQNAQRIAADAKERSSNASSPPVASATIGSSTPTANMITSMTMASMSDTDSIRSKWLLDGGSNTHVTNDSSNFTSFHPTYEPIHGIAGAVCLGRGTVILEVATPQGSRYVTLKDVAFVPTSRVNLLSHGLAEDVGVEFNRKQQVGRMSNGTVVFELERLRGLYFVEGAVANTVRSSCSSSLVFAVQRPARSTPASLDIWHLRMGHVSNKSPQLLSHSAEGVSFTPGSTMPGSADTAGCETCRITKAKRLISRLPSQRSTPPFESLHMDFMHVHEAYNADKLVLHFTDDFSGLHLVWTLRSTAQLLSLLQSLVAMVKTHFSSTIRSIRSDHDACRDQCTHLPSAARNCR